MDIPSNEIYLVVEILANNDIGIYLVVEILANDNIGIYLIVVYKLFVSRGRRFAGIHFQYLFLKTCTLNKTIRVPIVFRLNKTIRVSIVYRLCLSGDCPQGLLFPQRVYF